MRNITAPVQWAYLPFVPRPDFNIQNPFFLPFFSISLNRHSTERKKKGPTVQCLRDSFDFSKPIVLKGIGGREKASIDPGTAGQFFFRLV